MKIILGLSVLLLVRLDVIDANLKEMFRVPEKENHGSLIYDETEDDYEYDPDTEEDEYSCDEPDCFEELTSIKEDIVQRINEATSSEIERGVASKNSMIKDIENTLQNGNKTIREMILNIFRKLNVFVASGKLVTKKLHKTFLMYLESYSEHSEEYTATLVEENETEKAEAAKRQIAADRDELRKHSITSLEEVMTARWENFKEIVESSRRAVRKMLNNSYSSFEGTQPEIDVNSFTYVNGVSAKHPGVHETAEDNGEEMFYRDDSVSGEVSEEEVKLLLEKFLEENAKYFQSLYDDLLNKTKLE